MENFIFLIRHTPFWAVPVGLIAAEMGYFLWLKDRRRPALTFLSIGFICFLFILFYFFAGGPEKSIELLVRLFNIEI